MKLRQVVINLTVTLLSLFGIFLVLELFVFRVMFLPSDLPVLSARSMSVIKYVGGQSGTYRVRDEIEANYQINDQGWNSGRQAYVVDKITDKPRICVVGDSYIEALQVHHKKSVSELLESYLTPLVDSVYRFGISGAPLSHYLYLLRNEVSQYSPDIVVVNIVHNDILESIAPVSAATYYSSIARLELFHDEVVGIKQPQPYKSSITAWIKQTATFRYLWVRQQVRPQKLKRLWMQLFNSADDSLRFSGNIRVSDIDDKRLPKVVDYVFSELNRYQSENNTKILIVMDGNRRQIQQGIDSSKNRLLALNKLVEKYALRHDLSFIDLSSVFSDDYNAYGIPFSFPHDGHWNSYAHKLVAETIGNYINQQILDSDNNNLEPKFGL